MRKKEKIDNVSKIFSVVAIIFLLAEVKIIHSWISDSMSIGRRDIIVIFLSIHILYKVLYKRVPLSNVEKVVIGSILLTSGI